MRQRSHVTHSRKQWTHTATERGDQERSLRTQLARVKAERDQAQQALTEAQARLPQLESPAPDVVVLPKGDAGWISLQLFVEAHISFRAVSRVLTLLTHVLGIKQAPCLQTVSHWVIRLAIVRLQAARWRRGLSLSPAPCSHGLLWLRASRMGLGTGKM